MYLLQIKLTQMVALFSIIFLLLIAPLSVAASSWDGSYLVTSNVTSLGTNSYKYSYSITNLNQGSTYQGLDCFAVQVPVGADITNISDPAPYTSGYWLHTNGGWDTNVCFSSAVHQAGYQWLYWWGYSPLSVYPSGATAVDFSFVASNVKSVTSQAALVTYWGHNAPGSVTYTTPEGNKYTGYEGTITSPSTACDLKITDLHGSNAILAPDSGGSVKLSGSVSDSSGNTINWKMTIAGKTYDGTGKSPSVNWDGKDASGKVVDPGSYSATLTAQTEDGQCSDSKTIPFNVDPPPDGQCGLYVDFGSSANMASGNLSHRQDLFSAKGAALPLSMTLYYNSLDSFNGSLGRGWSNSYDNTLVKNSDGSVLLKEGNWRRRLYTLVNGAYVAKPNDYSTLNKNTDNTFTLIKKEGTKYNYDADGKIVSIIDRNGNTVNFVFSAGNLSAITDPAGHKAVLTYDADNHLTSLIDSSGNSYAFTYNNGTLAAVTYPDGGKWLYTYDDKAFMLTKTDPLGNITTYAYDDNHRVVSSTDTDGKTRSIAYPTGTDTTKTTTFIEKDGGVWSYTYDTQAGTLTSKTDPESGVTSYTYDANGNRLSTTAPDGTTTSSTYDGQGNMTSSTDSLGQTTAYTYNAFGQVTGIKDPQGNATGYAYDAAGNMTAMTDSTGATTTYAYDAKGNVTKVTNAAGQATTFVYDASGNLASTTDPSGAVTSFTYDAAGNMITQTDSNGAITRFEYNAKNQLVKMTDSLGNVTTYAYDLAGNRVSATDANGNTTLYAYNAKGQVIKTTDALGNATTYTYGATGCPSCGGGVDKLTALTDANGNSTTYQYDTLGRLIAETDPLGNITTYSYDAKGNLIEKTDANGNTIQYTYDSLGRLLEKSYPDNTEETFTYDANGNILTATNKNISYTMTYDAAGRMLTSTDSNGRNISYTYDTLGNKTKMTSPEGKAITYRYDAANRLTTITNGGIFNFSYDQLGRRTKLLYPNGASANYSYDNAGRLASLTHKAGKGKIIDSFTYSLDKVGNRLSRTEPEGKTTYGYDKIYRLLQALPAKPHGWDNDRDDRHDLASHLGENYVYDPVGNRLTGPHDKLSYLYNTGNQLTEQSLKNHNNHKEHSYGKTEYTYDKNGNLIKKVEPEGHHQKTTKLYTYDFENRLVKVEIQRGHHENVATFTYDPFGRRLSKTVQKEEIDDDDKDRDGRGCGHDHHAPRTTKYFYDSQNILMEYDEKGKIVARYVQGLGTDEHLAIYKKGETYYYHADGLGSITAMTDKRGNVEQKYEYDSFGNMKQDGEEIDQPYTYTGREWDKETGLYYYRARYYDPMEGRFISKDPIGFKGGINVYAYVQNNPVRFIDSLGMSTTTDIISVIPFIGTLFNLFTTPTGSKCSDYKINVNCELCDENLIVQRCEESIRVQGATFIGNYNRLTIGHEIIDAVAAGAAALLQNYPAFIVFSVDSVVDLAISVYKNNKITEGSNQAKALCKIAAKNCKN